MAHILVIEIHTLLDLYLLDIDLWRLVVLEPFVVARFFWFPFKEFLLLLLLFSLLFHAIIYVVDLFPHGAIMKFLVNFYLHSHDLRAQH